MHAVDLRKKAQSAPEFLKVSPNGKMPAIIDHDPAGAGSAITLFESGAILQYRAEKSRQLMPPDLRQRLEVLQWLFWQVFGFSPMAGQQGFFRRAAEQVPFAIDRFTEETTRLYGVLNRRLADHLYLGGETYSIADISACV
jgi:GSH-dependent disulfide-bond oxidoreductase